MTYRPSIVRSSVAEEVVTVKFEAESALPPGVVTANFPVLAPVGTVVEICVALFTVKDAAVPFRVSAVAPVRLVPVTVTAVPAWPEAGLKLTIVGAEAVTVKLVAEVALPAGVVTEIFPVAAPVGTVVVI